MSQVLGIHIDNYMVLYEHCGGTTEPARAVGVHIQWRTVTVVRLVECKYTARGATPSTHAVMGISCGGYGLVSCTCTAAEAQAAILVPGLWWAKGKGGSWVKL